MSSKYDKVEQLYRQLVPRLSRPGILGQNAAADRSVLETCKLHRGYAPD